jgi:hypothetical protein
LSGTIKQLLSRNHLGIPLKPTGAPTKTKQIGTRGVGKVADIQIPKTTPKKRDRKPASREQKSAVIPDAYKEGEVAELITRGQQLLEELDKAHSRLYEASEEALSPDPQAWRGVRAAMTSYTANYAELIQLSKRLNRLIAQEHPEPILPPTPLKLSIFEGDL